MADIHLPALRKVHTLCGCMETPKSIYKGVSFDKRTGHWQAQLHFVSKGNAGEFRHEHIGHFDTDWEAAMAYDHRIRELYGLDGLYNFPHEGEHSVFCGHGVEALVA